MSKIKFEFTYDTSTGEFSVVNTSTGEVKNAFSKKPKKSLGTASDGPTLILEDTKYQLSADAIELLGVQPKDKLDIKYKKRGTEIVPVIGSDANFGTNNGNTLTKSGTVLYRGAKREELAKYGTEFKLEPDTDGIFFLIKKDSDLEKLLDDKDEKNPALDDFDFAEDTDLQSLIDDPDATIVESSIFSL